VCVAVGFGCCIMRGCTVIRMLVTNADIIKVMQFIVFFIWHDSCPEKALRFLLSIYDSNESIDFVHGKSKNFY
jgi:hypothetical protein